VPKLDSVCYGPSIFECTRSFEALSWAIIVDAYKKKANWRRLRTPTSAKHSNSPLTEGGTKNHWTEYPQKLRRRPANPHQMSRALLDNNSKWNSPVMGIDQESGEWCCRLSSAPRIFFSPIDRNLYNSDYRSESMPIYIYAHGQPVLSRNCTGNSTFVLRSPAHSAFSDSIPREIQRAHPVCVRYNQFHYERVCVPVI